MRLGPDVVVPGHIGEGIFQYAIALKFKLEQLSTPSRLSKNHRNKGIATAQFHCFNHTLESEWNLIEEAH